MNLLQHNIHDHTVLFDIERFPLLENFKHSFSAPATLLIGHLYKSFDRNQFIKTLLSDDINKSILN